MAETAGHRVYLVRLALGDGVRDPLPMRDFAARLARAGGKGYSASKVSDLETGKRRLSLNDATVIASVDPRTRGRAWLAWGDQGETARRQAADADAAATGESLPEGSYVGHTADELAPTEAREPAQDAPRLRTKGRKR